MLQSSIRKTCLFLFAFSFFVIDAKINFKKSEISSAFEKKINTGLQKVIRQFKSEAKKTKEQFLNMIILAFIGNDAMKSLMSSDEKTQEDFTKKFQSFISDLTPETMALQQMIGDVFNAVITKEMEKGEKGYFSTIKSKDDFDKEFAKLSVTYQLIVYDELYNNGLTPNEQQLLHDVFGLANQNTKSSSKKLLPKPEELYGLLQETIERTLEFMDEYTKQLVSQEGNSINS